MISAMVSRFPTGSQLRRRRILGAMALLLPLPCVAQVGLAASATGQFEYNSNLFDLQRGVSVTGYAPDQRADTFYTYGSTIQLNDLWQHQRLFATVSGSEFQYDHFTQLNHGEFRLDGGVDWVLGPSVDGTLSVLRSSTMESLYNLLQSNNTVQAQLPLQTEQRETAKIGFLLNPDWSLEGTGYHRTLLEPLDGEPNLKLTETAEQADLRFIGTTGMTAAVSAGHSVGDYTGAVGNDNPSYQQTGFHLNMSYGAGAPRPVPASRCSRVKSDSAIVPREAR